MHVHKNISVTAHIIIRPKENVKNSLLHKTGGNTILACFIQNQCIKQEGIPVQNNTMLYKIHIQNKITCIDIHLL